MRCCLQGLGSSNSRALPWGEMSQTLRAATMQRPHQESAVPALQAGQQSRVVRKVCPVSVPLTIEQSQVTGQVPALIPQSSSGAGPGADMAETAQTVIDRWNGVPEPRGLGWVPQVRLDGTIIARGLWQGAPLLKVVITKFEKSPVLL